MYVWICVNLCEFMWIYVNLRVDYLAVQQCGSVRQCGRQCVAVRTVVCAQYRVRSSLRQCARWCIFGSARGSVRLFGSAAVCGSVRQWRGCVRQCARLCAAARAAVCGSVWKCVALSTVVSAQCAQYARLCAAVRLVVCCGVEMRVRVAVQQCAAQCCSAWQCTVCGSVRGRMRQRVAVRTVLVCGSALGSVRHMLFLFISAQLVICRLPSTPTWRPSSQGGLPIGTA
jgi:hypothetical protein